MSSIPRASIDEPEVAGLLTTDGKSAKDDRRDDPASAPLANLPRADPRAEDAGGMSGSRAGHGGVGSTLTKLSAQERARLTELARVRQYAHIEKMEELLTSGRCHTVDAADAEAGRLVPSEAGSVGGGGAGGASAPAPSQH